MEPGAFLYTPIPDLLSSTHFCKTSSNAFALSSTPCFFQIRGGEQKRGRPPPSQWPCLERRRSGRCSDRADDLYTGLTRDVATTQYTQRLGAAVGTGAASPRTQPPRSRIVNHGLARYRLTLRTAGA
jgi:hypothetical protein